MKLSAIPALVSSYGFVLLLALSIPSAAQQQTANPEQTQPPKSMQDLTIRDLWKEGGLNGRAPAMVKWSPDGAKVSYQLTDDAGDRSELWYIDAATGKPAVLVAAQKLTGMSEAPPTGGKKMNERLQERRHNPFGGYYWSPDSKHLLFDARGQLWYFRLDTGTGTQMTTSSDPQTDPKFSPDGHFLSYVKKHQLFVRGIDRDQAHEWQLTSAREDAPQERLRDLGIRKGKNKNQDTTKLDENILDGEVDWVYAEELGVTSNYFWSPDSKQVLFLQMDETNVPVYPIEDFMLKHPTISEQKYPKAGDTNPAVRIGVLGREDRPGKVRWVTLPPGMTYEYMPRFGWVNDHVIYAELLNRKQSQIDLIFADLQTGKSRVVLTEKSDPFLEVNDLFRVFKSGDRFLWGSWRNGHTHLYLYSFEQSNPVAAEAKLLGQITKGDFEVAAVDALDEAAGIVYYESNEAGPEGDQFAAWRERNLVARKLDGTKIAGQYGGSRTATFAPDQRHFVEAESTYAQAPAMSFCSAGKQIECARPFFRSRPLAFQFAAPHWLQLKAEDGTPLEGELLLPTVSAGQKIPVLLNPYGGPQGQEVVDHWGGSNTAFDNILLRDGIAILRVDNRGMGNRGRKFAQVLYGNLGVTELQDQLAALDQVLQQFPQLDAGRIGWWGWSYGGYMTLYAMTHTDRIKAGFAVAPVTKWELYDSIYTERYMGLPKQNADAYAKASPVSSAAHLHGSLTEAHGTSDDNVHMQNTMQWIQAMIDANQQYSLLLYPGKTHGIAGEAARTQLFERIESHFVRELK
ncbi:MAG: alpha/beta fold hydrolase [Acidobacteriaceae bacterium]